MKKRWMAALAAAALLVVPVLAMAAAGPPRVATTPTDSMVLTDTYALLGGTVNPNGTNTNYHFEWGETATYGQTTPDTNAGSGTADVPVDVSVDGLKPDTTYHYRLVAFPATPADPNAPGYVYGEDLTFKTAPALHAVVTGGKTAVKAGRAQVTIACVGPIDEVCQGRLQITGKLAGHSRGLGTGDYRIAVGQSRTIGVSLNQAARKALRTGATHHLLADATTKPTGSTVTSGNKLILIG
jgi:hypothetical protein